MKNFAKLLSVLLSVFLIISVCPFCLAQSEFDPQITLSGNSGAVITDSAELTATCQSDLVTVACDGGKVTVTAVDGAVGIAEVTVSDGQNSKTFEIPVGYTAFEFSESGIIVYSGSDTKYEVVGINTADAEIVPETADDGNGNTVYKTGEGYSLNVAIKAKGGTYVFFGQSSDASVCVKKEATAPAVLLFAGLDLTSSFTSPLTIKKNSTSTVTVNALEGFENTLSDSELNNADTYGDTADGGDGTNAAYAESTVIKGKTAANLTLTGKGVLNLNCTTKNAVKVGTSGSLTIDSLTLNVNSAKNGLSCDNIITINSGKLSITAEADGIRTDPDAVDADNGAAGNIFINGGEITIKSGSDGIQSAQDIVITDGSFNITAGDGYDDKNFNSDTDSCKGIKASFNTDETADTTDSTNSITISGGTFVINTADDSIHSDSYILITGGKFELKTGDDGIHADTTLDVGTENGSNDSLNINVLTCYEGLEAGTVNIYCGTMSVTASDDGINAAGGSDAGQGPGGGGFNPGGGRPGQGGPGGNGGNPGGNGGTAPGQGGSSEYSINIFGGDIYVNAEGDGLDSNGDLNITGGNLVIWGMRAGGDNEPLDCDGTLTVNGATVFGAGSSTMTTTPKSSQNYITSRSSAAAGKTINIVKDGTTVFNIKAVKNINYVIYSSPEMESTSGWSIVINDDPLIDDGSSGGDSDDDYTLGDVNADGKISAVDALMVLQNTVNIINLEDKAAKAADVDLDQKITSNDALLILQYSVSKITSF